MTQAENTIATTLRTARRAAQITQAEAASSCGVSRWLVSRIESGLSVPSLPLLIALARLYKIPSDALVNALSADLHPLII